MKKPGPIDIATLSPNGIAFATSNPDTTEPDAFTIETLSPSSKRSGSTSVPFKSLPVKTNHMALYPTSVSKEPGIANLAEFNSFSASEFSA